MLRRQMLAAALVLAAAPAFGQAWPNKPITMIVPFAAGGPTDLLARIIGERMGKELGQQFIIENVTGAAGTIAMAKLARAAPDGYTIGIGHVGTNVANAVIYTKLGFDLVTDLEPIARLPANPMLVVSTNNVPAKTLKELVDYLKANPDKVSGGTAGIGSGSHLGALAFNKATGATYQLVPYRGTGPAMQDLISGQIQVMVDQSSNSLPQVQAGKIRAYAADLGQALARHGRHPDGGRSRLSDGGLDLERPVGAQGHAQGHHRQAERRGRHRPVRPRRAQAHGGARAGPADGRGDEARDLRRLPEGRVRPLEADPRSRRREGGVTTYRREGLRCLIARQLPAGPGCR